MSVYRLGKTRRERNASDLGLVGNPWKETQYYLPQANWQIVDRWGNKEKREKII